MGKGRLSGPESSALGRGGAEGRPQGLGLEENRFRVVRAVFEGTGSDEGREVANPSAQQTRVAGFPLGWFRSRRADQVLRPCRTAAASCRAETSQPACQ